MPFANTAPASKLIRETLLRLPPCSASPRARRNEPFRQLMDEAKRHLPAAEVERSLLAALCAPALDLQTRAQILQRLAAHIFANPDHEAIFRVIANITRPNSDHTRDTL